MGSTASQHGSQTASASTASSPGTACTPPSRRPRRTRSPTRIRELGLRTVRLIVVDQHGIPRSKSLSPERGHRRDVERPGLLRRDLQPGHRQPGVRARVRGRRRLRDRRADRVPRRGPGAGPDHVPGAAVGRPDRLDALRRVLLQRRADAARRPRADAPGSWPRWASAGYDYLAGIEVEYYIVKLDADRITPENAGFTPAAARRQRLRARLPVPVRGAAGQRHRHAGGDPRRPGRGRAAAAVDGGRVGPRPDGVQLQPDRRAWPRPTRWCCSAPRSSRCASAAGCWRRSCAGRRCRTSSPPAGTCTSRCSSRTDGRNAFASADEALSPDGPPVRGRPARARACR